MTCHTSLIFVCCFLEGIIELGFAFNFIFNMKIFSFSHLLWGISKHNKVISSQHHIICSLFRIYRLLLLIFTINLLWIYFSIWLGITKQVEPVRSIHLTCEVNRSTCYVFNKYFFYLILYFFFCSINFILFVIDV
jgi:hypothetical protein